MKYWARTHAGLKRPHNEDAVLQCEGRLFGVADGMGGHKAGEVASMLAVDTLLLELRDQPPGAQTLSDAVALANAVIYQQSRQIPEREGMGTTLSVLWSAGEEGWIGHVGDSRIYRLREGDLQRLTEDHSVVEEWVRQGLLTQEEALVHPYRHVITRALGISESLEADVQYVGIAPGDLYLLCTDGLSNMVPDHQIAQVLQEHPPEQAAQLLLELALAAGATDNVTFLIVAADGEVAG